MASKVIGEAWEATSGGHFWRLSALAKYWQESVSGELGTSELKEREGSQHRIEDFPAPAFT